MVVGKLFFQLWKCIELMKDFDWIFYGVLPAPISIWTRRLHKEIHMSISHEIDIFLP